jgi:hypothetical protein
MLENLSDQVRNCLRRAEEFARKADSQSDPELRQVFLAMEARWLKLARSYELTERLSAFAQTSAKFYSVHMLRRTGVWETEIQTRLGVLPSPGDEVAAIPHGEIVKGRVTVTTTNPDPAESHPAIVVRAEEI